MSDDKRSELARLLANREVGGVDQIVGGLSDDELDPSLAAVAWWDAQPDSKKGSGLLVWALRNLAEIPSKAAVTREITPRLEEAVKGSCLSPNGCTRDEARGIFRLKATKGLGMDVDDLIDRVMGAQWQETPPAPEYVPDRTAEQMAVMRRLRYGTTSERDGLGKLDPRRHLRPEGA